MYLDVKFFKNIIRMLETNHNLVRPMEEVTEAWKFHVDKTIMQCKEIIAAAEFQEEREALFQQFDEIVTRLDTLGWYPILKSESYIEDNNEEQDS